MSYAYDIIRFLNSKEYFANVDVRKVVRVNVYYAVGVLDVLVALGFLDIVYTGVVTVYRRVKKITLG